LRRLAAAVLVIASVASAGCGARSGNSNTTRGLPLELGRSIFVHDCAACHTLTGRERGALGGDLLNAHLEARDIASFARVMPTPHRLSPGAAAAVAAYVDFVGRSPKRGR
jgi:mono/diheme cytochrome c family protein